MNFSDLLSSYPPFQIVQKNPAPVSVAGVVESAQAQLISETVKKAANGRLWFAVMIWRQSSFQRSCDIMRSMFIIFRQRNMYSDGLKQKAGKRSMNVWRLFRRSQIAAEF